MRKVNILIAEDDLDDFLVLKEAIEDVLPKFNIVHCRHGMEVIHQINERPDLDLIFLDINIPRKTGIECLINIRERKEFASTPIIIYSTSSHFDDIDRCYKNGCTLYLVKPTSSKDLVTQIKKIFFRIGLPKKDLRDKEMFVVVKHEE